jgi:hypothetical protein
MVEFLLRIDLSVNIPSYLRPQHNTLFGILWKIHHFLLSKIMGIDEKRRYAEVAICKF